MDKTRRTYITACVHMLISNIVCSSIFLWHKFKLAANCNRHSTHALASYVITVIKRQFIPVFFRGFPQIRICVAEELYRNRAILNGAVQLHGDIRIVTDKSFQLFTYLGAAFGTDTDQLRDSPMHKAFMKFDVFLFSRCRSMSAAVHLLTARYKRSPLCGDRARMTGQLIREISIAALLSNTLSSWKSTNIICGHKICNVF